MICYRLVLPAKTKLDYLVYFTVAHNSRTQVRYVIYAKYPKI